MAVSAQFHVCRETLNYIDLARENLLEISRATSSDRYVQREVGNALQWLEAAHALLRGETV